MRKPGVGGQLPLIRNKAFPAAAADRPAAPTPSLSPPTLRKLHIRRIERSDRGASQQMKRPRHIVAQDLQRTRDASVSRSGHSVSVGPTDKHRLRTQTNRLHDIAASPEPPTPPNNQSHSPPTFFWWGGRGGGRERQ